MTKNGHYLFSENTLKENIQEIKKAFSSISSAFNLAYSIKANYYSGIINCCKKKGVFFDVASLFELEILLKQGVKGEQIWTNTPYLSEGLTMACIQRNVLMHIDNLDQLTSILKLVEEQQKQVRIGLRINFPKLGRSRFGLAEASDELRNALNLIDSNDLLNLESIHTHFSGSDRSADNFASRAEHLYKWYKKNAIGKGVKSLNIGGGIAGPMPEEVKKQLNYQVPTWQQYAQAVQERIPEMKKEKLNLVIEPGMALVANVFSFQAEVYGIKELEQKHYALINCTKTFLKPTGHQKALSFEVIPKEETKEERKEYLLAGISCMESDLLGTYSGHLSVGDQIVFKNVGAYTLSYSPDFIFAKAAVKEE